MDGTRSALIIASSEYTDPGLRRLVAPASDAQALAAVLHDPLIGDFQVRTQLNKPAHEVNFAVDEFFADRRPDDLLLLHFSCHGVKAEDGELYLATTDTMLRRLAATAVAAEFVNRRMSRSRSRRVVLLLDCCYAGAFERGMTARAGADIAINEQFGGRGRAVITASSAMEYAFEGNEVVDDGTVDKPTPSVFTSALVEGLQTGEADRDQDGMVTLDELYDFVYDRVRSVTPNQTPGKWTFAVEGDLCIARRARPVTQRAPLPAELEEAIESPLSAVRSAAVHELARLAHGRHAGLALAATRSLERLVQDDSRTVAAAASAALDTQPQPAADDKDVVAVDSHDGRPRASPGQSPTPSPRQAHSSTSQPPTPRKRRHPKLICEGRPSSTTAASDDLPVALRRRPSGRIAALSVLALGVLVAAVAIILLARGRTASSTVTVLIPATQTWTDTGVKCNAGDALTITARGTVQVSSGGTAIGPNGLTNPHLDQFNIAALTKAAHGALIGMIRPTDAGARTAPFVVGTNWSQQCAASGALLLGINDSGTRNNSGIIERPSPGDPENNVRRTRRAFPGRGGARQLDVVRTGRNAARRIARRVFR